jgi:ubiquinone/menaquinone biosynthesis C-methylase UbiE
MSNFSNPSGMSDRSYLLSQQYRDPRNLDARVAIHARFSTNRYGWHRWVFDHFDLAAGARVLELGGGPGHLWASNRDRIPPGWQITVTDFSPGMVRAAREQLGSTGRRFGQAVSDAQAIGFPSEHFQAVIANHMLYHVPDRARALQEIRRVLVPGGRLFAATVGQGHMRELDEGPLGELWVGQQAPENMAPAPGGTAAFSLETGEAQLAPWFEQVTVDRYVDALEVTDPEVLVAYVLSMRDLPADRLARLRAYVTDQIGTHGAIHISKDAGLFQAHC